MLILSNRNQGRSGIGRLGGSLTGECPRLRTFDGRLVFAEELFPVFDEADQNHDNRAKHPQKKERLKQPNYDRGQDHE